MGHTKNPDIRIAKSIVDYIFRWLGITFLPGYREANAYRDESPAVSGVDAEIQSAPAGRTTATPEPPTARKASAAKTSPTPKPAKGDKGTSATTAAAILKRAATPMKVDLNGGASITRTEQFASFQADAPSCDNCGAITVRNGNCYLCHNCGNSMGCS
jgi:ribonucleoside-diphosphate reductase alpha chain